MSKVREFLERVLKRFYEGPETPERYAEEARLFELGHPLASPAEWRDFVHELADKAYRDGYVRGLEHAVRKPETAEEQERDEERHDWKIGDDELVDQLLEEGDPNDPLRGLPASARAQVFDQIGEAMGTHRIVVLKDEPPIVFEPDDDG